LPASPLAVLDTGLRLLGANREFHRVFGSPTEPLETSLARLLDSEPGHAAGPGNGDGDIRTIIQAVLARGEVRETVLPARGARPARILVLIPAYPRDAADGRGLLVVEDATERAQSLRHLAERLASSELMMEEMRHRMVNSLQIVASVVRIKAHLVQSEDARAHLEDVHQRVLSIAALQDQLELADDAKPGSVSQYLSAVCLRLANSLIDSVAGIELRVEADDLAVRPETCISMGLVVTELVTNALKHAFPGRRKGVIRVHFVRHGSGWQLSVADDGVGCDLASAGRSAGVGTRIVNTLAKRLDARLEMSNSEPHGLTVTLTHRRDAPGSA